MQVAECALPDVTFLISVAVTIAGKNMSERMTKVLAAALNGGTMIVCCVTAAF